MKEINLIYIMVTLIYKFVFVELIASLPYIAYHGDAIRLLCNNWFVQRHDDARIPGLCRKSW